MRFDPTQEFERQAAHSAKFAMLPGFWAHAKEQAQQMQDDDTAQGLWRELYGNVSERVKAAGFHPAVSERGQWWVIESKIPQSRPSSRRMY